MKWMIKIAYIQGIFYFLTGIWPIVDIISFMKVTGPKTDIWLVKTVGVLVIVISVAILTAAVRKKIPFEIFLLGSAGCVGFILVDVIYVFNDTIPPVYLLDAAVELLILIGWLTTYKMSINEKST